jgi:hypothetical protein
MKKIFLISLSIIFVMFCFSSFKSSSNKKDKLVGIWVSSEFKDGVLKLIKSTNFQKDKSGIEFKNDRSIIKRQNSGWCGTPPIHYSNYNGTWKFISDSTMTIRYDYWGGIAEEDWKIIKLDYKNLEVERMNYKRKKN